MRGNYDVRARLNEHLHPEAWQVFDLKDEVASEHQTQDPAITDAKDRARQGRVRATWHSRTGALQGEVDYSTVFSRASEPGYGAIEKALRQGLELHSDLSGSGLRVIIVEQVLDPQDKIKNKVIAHASHYSFDIALSMVAQKLSGKSPQGPRYLTGSTAASGRLDDWILHGRSLMATASGDDIFIRLYGLDHKTRDGKLVWGTLSKQGHGKDFFEASQAALESPEVFTPKEPTLPTPAVIGEL